MTSAARLPWSDRANCHHYYCLSRSVLKHFDCGTERGGRISSKKRCNSIRGAEELRLAVYFFS
jgi:hypothetical protein